MADNREVTAAIVVGTLALFIAIPALVMAAVDIHRTPDVMGVQNLSSVAGQTDASGNFSVGGVLNVNGIVPSSSPSTGSIITRGGVGVAGSVVTGQGLYGPVFDALGPMSIGASFQTSIDMGRVGIPITLRSNQLTIVADTHCQGLSPITSLAFDIGNPTAQFRNAYFGGLFYNTTLFPTTVAGGVFSMTGDGPVCNAPLPSATSLMPFSAFESSLAVPYTFPANSLVNGDTLTITCFGNLSTTAAQTVGVLVVVGGQVVVQSDVVVPATQTGFFNFTSIITVRNAGNNGQILGQARLGYNALQDQSVNLATGINFTAALPWDIQIVTDAVSPFFSAQARACTLTKAY